MTLRLALVPQSAIRHFARRTKPENARVAKENWRLVESGGYADVGGHEHALKLPRDAVNRTHFAPSTAGRSIALRHAHTAVCVARIDTATALRTMHTLGARKCAALNFANAHHAGGGYLNGARAQEEDLCRLIPTLYTSLKRLKYPMKENSCGFTQGWLARTAGSYALDGGPILVNILSAAMPNIAGGSAFSARLDPTDEPWRATVRVRIRAVLHAAREEGCDSIILGAFGCGAFGNPPDRVAPLFAEVLASPEFRGAFSAVVFAILEFQGSDSGNVAAFARACGDGPGGLCQPARAAAPPVQPAPATAAATAGETRADSPTSMEIDIT